LADTILIYHAQRADRFAASLRPLLPDAVLIAAGSAAEAAPHMDRADVLFGWRFPPELYGQAPRLRWVQSMGAGVEDLIAAPLPEGCLLTRVEGLFGGSMSEYAFAHMLAHSQQSGRQRAAQEAARWEPFLVGRLAGKRLGIAGAGSIGAEIARRAKAFDMEVWALVRTTRPMENVDRVLATQAAAEFCASVDYLISTLPHTEEAVGLVNPLQMKPGALLINIGRGATIDEAAILQAVEAGRIQAVLDVFQREPLPPEHPFWRTPGITVTPHISGPSVPEEVAAYFADNYRRFALGQPLLGLVNRQRGY